MANKKKYFGTDGIRNRVGQGLISPDQVLKLGWATGKVLKEQGASTVMIGKDTRISGYMFESSLEAGFIAAGIDVLLLGPMPTPAISYLTQTFNADLGVVISASHNPHHDNGIKFFGADGRKVSDEIEHAIETAFELPIEVVDSEHLGKAKRIDDAAGRYIEFCKSTYRAKTNLKGLKVILDCANGATYHIAPHVFEELGADVFVIGNQPNGININQKCGATDLDALSDEVISQGADLGIAYDGDGDRVMMVDSKGHVLDGDDILYFLSVGAKKKPKAVVGTVMSNMGLEVALKKQGIKLHRTPVGDRYVMQLLVEHGLLFGSEPSGHVLCLDKIETGDGIIASLQVLALLKRLDVSIETLRSGLTKFPQVLSNVRVADASQLSVNKALQAEIDAVESDLADKGRVLIRASGTEPLIRVMVEAEDMSMVESSVERLVKVVKSEFC